MPSGDLSLAIGYWIVSHKATLKRWWAISFMVIIFMSFFWLVTSISVFASQSSRVEHRLITSADALRIYHPDRLGIPKPIQLGKAVGVNREVDRIDMTAQLTNPNQNWSARAVRYHFTIDGRPTPTNSVLLNPGEGRDLIALNQPGRSSSSVAVVLEQVDWARGEVDRIQNIFSVQDVSWEPSHITRAGQTIESLTLKAKLRNQSVYNFFSVTVSIVLLAGNQIVAVDELSLDRWSSRTDKPITISWPYRISGVTQARIMATTDLSNRTNRF